MVATPTQPCLVASAQESYLSTVKGVVDTGSQGGGVGALKHRLAKRSAESAASLATSHQASAQLQQASSGAGRYLHGPHGAKKKRDAKSKRNTDIAIRLPPEVQTTRSSAGSSFY